MGQEKIMNKQMTYAEEAALLKEHKESELSNSSLRGIILNNGPKQIKQGRLSLFHQPRQRRAQVGVEWLDERTLGFALYAAINDATGMSLSRSSGLLMPRRLSTGTSSTAPLGLYSD